MAEYEPAVDALMEAFSAEDDASRDERFSRAVTDDVAVRGPDLHEKFDSREQLRMYFGEMATQVPPATKMVRTTPVHEHDGYVRWRFSFRLPDGSEPYRFEAFAEGRDGLLSRIVTFDVSAE